MERNNLQGSIDAGDTGMVLEHLAAIDAEPGEIKVALSTAILNRAAQREAEACRVGSYTVLNISGTILRGDNSFEKRRAEKLRVLAQKILAL